LQGRKGEEVWATAWSLEKCSLFWKKENDDDKQNSTKRIGSMKKEMCDKFEIPVQELFFKEKMKIRRKLIRYM
jgi:hypothetical protein